MQDGPKRLNHCVANSFWTCYNNLRLHQTPPDWKRPYRSFHFNWIFSVKNDLLLNISKRGCWILISLKDYKYCTSCVNLSRGLQDINKLQYTMYHTRLYVPSHICMPNGYFDSSSMILPTLHTADTCHMFLFTMHMRYGYFNISSMILPTLHTADTCHMFFMYHAQA